MPPRRLRVFVPSTPHNAEPHLKPPADVDGGSVGRPEVRRKQHPKPPAGDECNIKAADGVHVRNESGELFLPVTLAIACPSHVHWSPNILQAHVRRKNTVTGRPPNGGGSNALRLRSQDCCESVHEQNCSPPQCMRPRRDCTRPRHVESPKRLEHLLTYDTMWPELALKE